MNVVKIQKIANQVRGVSYKPTDLHDSLNESSVILLRANNIDDGKINFDDVVYVDKRKVSKEQYLIKGDILVCASSGSKQLVGKAASVNFDQECTFGAFCKVVRPQKQFAEYLGKYFQSNTYRSKISAVALGANINNIRNEHIDSLELNVYDEEENKDIVQVISRVQAIIDNRRQELQKLDELIKARFVELFGDPIVNSMDWGEELIGDSCFVTKLAGFEYTQYIHYEDSGDVVMVKAQNVKNGKLNRKDLSYISKEVSDSLPRSQLEVGDVVMTYVGANIGDVAVIDDEYKYHLAPNVAKIRPNAEKYNSIYFMHMLMFLNSYIVGNSADTAKAALGMERIRKLKVFFPPIELQNQFAAFVEQIDKSKVAVQKALEEAQLLFDSLMQKYFG